MKQTIRVLLTNGTRTVQIFWLYHKGTDIFYGTGHSLNAHYSYHRSGATHSKTPRGYESLGKRLPLDKFKEYASLHTVAVPTSFLDEDTKLPDFKGSSKGDVVVTLDMRTMPKRKAVNVMVALVEPGRPDLSVAGRLKTDQVILLTTVSPWVEIATLYG